MSIVASTIDKLLGPIAPNKQAKHFAPDPKKAVVFTAAGDQGSSVCESLIIDGMFIVTGVTIYPHGEVANGFESCGTAGSHLGLRAKGVKIVKGDISDVSTYEQYLEGMDCAFVNADFLNVFHSHALGPEVTAVISSEIKQSIAAVEACVKAGIKHIVYSGLDDLPPGVEVPHCTSKAEVVKYIQKIGAPATILYPSHPFSDLLNWDLIKPHERGAQHGFLLTIPAPDDCSIPGYAVEQVGDWVKVAFQHPNRWIGKDMHACGERLTITKMAHDLHKISKKPVETLHLSKEEFYSEKHKAKIGLPMWSQYRACLEEHFTRDEEKSRMVAPHQWRFKQWALQSPKMKDILGVQ